ncbi:hypothetical protein ABH931_001686 [Streptacidiphilus sp. MAP12-33]|uniref:divisome protein SepX/GlpR n=1 Tax=Streptacidiphilus sp. MAP12-33 TaxID=3156266 RepID=UPI003512394B
MSSSGLIYAVIVGAWAAYLVPMWLRRQDELNEARPTERFSTAIRLLSGRAAMERKISRQLEETQPLAAPNAPDAEGPAPVQGRGAAEDTDPRDDEGGNEGGNEGEDEAFARPAYVPRAPHAPQVASGAHQGALSPAVASRRRAALLARRRRMVVLLFVAFTVGMVVAAVGGVALLWIPAVPAVLFSLYIAQMRRQERRRYEVKIDRRRAVEAAQHVRRQAAERREAATAAGTRQAPREASAPRSTEATARAADDQVHRVARTASGAGTPGAVKPGGAEQGGTQRGGAPQGVGRADPWADHDLPEHAGPVAPAVAQGDGGWDPVPVPLPTYVTAPVAPRATFGLDLSAPDTYSAGRTGKPRAAGQAPAPAQPTTPARAPQAPTAPPRRQAPKPATPLFDQFADDTPRAANE